MLFRRPAPFLAVLMASLALLSCGGEHRSADRPKGDPCRLPYLDGKDHFVAAVDLFRGSGSSSLHKWSRGGKKASVTVKAPADGFPGGGKLKAILMLSGHRPIEWKIDPKLARMTSAVLLVGYNEQRVTGIGNDIPVAHASREAEIKHRPSCVALSPAFAKNADASRFFVLNGVVDTMLALGVDRYYHGNSAAVVTIPSRNTPHHVEK